METIRFCRKLLPELSNFHPCKVNYDGVTYNSSEAAFQAQKAISPETKQQFVGLTAQASKKLGKSIPLRKDWESVKFEVMCKVLEAKFTQNEDLKQILLSTGSAEIVEDTTAWHDNTWGDCQCSKCQNKVGMNLLGQALMLVREAIK